jgi:hypothetical protein
LLTELFSGAAATGRHARSIYSTSVPFPLDPAFESSGSVTTSDSEAGTSAKKSAKRSKEDEAEEEQPRRKRRKGEAVEALLQNTIMKFSDFMTQRTEDRIAPYQKAIRIAFNRHKEETAQWKLKASKALQAEVNAYLYIEAEDKDKDEILSMLIDEL